jgi:hypothetical protein
MNQRQRKLDESEKTIADYEEHSRSNIQVEKRLHNQIEITKHVNTQLVSLKRIKVIVEGELLF